MRGSILGWLLLVGFFSWPLLVAQDKPTRSVEELIADLGSSSFAKREKASQELWQLGEEARPALEAALKSDQDEVVRRAKLILAKFDSGNVPNVTPELKDLIDKFRTGDLRKRTQAIRELCHYGDTGPSTLRRLIIKEVQDPNLRTPFFWLLSNILRDEVPKLIVQGHARRAEQLLETATLESSSPGHGDYAYWVVQQGRGAEVAAQLETRLSEKSPDPLAIRKVLVAIYQALGDSQAALKHALEIEKQDGPYSEVTNSLLEAAGLWQLLAERNELGEANSRDGLKIYHLRMAGRTRDAQRLLEQQKEEDLDHQANRGSIGMVDPATLALMLNNKPLEGMERLKIHANAPHILADVMASRLQFQDALDLVRASEKGDEASALNRGMLRQLHGTRKGRILWQLGQKDAAIQVFNKLAQELTGGPENRDGRPYNSYAITQLVRTEVRAGRYDLACEHLATALAVSGLDGQRPRSYGQDAFELIFDLDADVAGFWWRVLRTPANRPEGETAAQTLLKVRRLILGELKAEEVQKAIAAGLKDNGPPQRRANRNNFRDEPYDDSDEHHTLKPMALAVALRAAGQLTEAIETLSRHANNWPKPNETMPPFDPDTGFSSPARSSRSWIFGIDEHFRFWLELGDYLMEANQPAEAAKRYHQGWEQERGNGLLLLLSGKALIKAGDLAEGKKRVAAAHLVPLGNARLRGRILEELITRGYLNEVRLEIQGIRRTGWVSELHSGNVWNQVARGSIVLKDFATAALAHNRAIYYLLRTPGVSYVEGYAYLTVPMAARVAQARQLIQQGKIQEGLAQAYECLEVMPGHTDLTIGVVTALDAAGKKADADGFFQASWKSLRGLADKYPESAWARNQAAWVAAGCRRELAVALADARQAVELEPNIKSFQETLAEVQFRRGDREAAVAIMKKLVAQDRRSFHYKRQLERYQTAAFDSPLPDSDED